MADGIGEHGVAKAAGDCADRRQAGVVTGAARFPPVLRVYAALLWGLAGVVVLGAGRSGLPARQVTPDDWRIALALMLCIGIAGAFPLTITSKVKMHMGTAPLFAAALLFPVPLAAGVGAVGAVLAQVALVARRRGPRFDAFFNTGRTVVQVAAAGTVFHPLSGVVALDGPLGAHVVVAAVLAGLVYYAINAAVVYGAAGMTLRQDPLTLWLTTVRFEAPQQGALLLFGSVAALTVDSNPVLALAMVLPIGVVYYSLRSSLALRAQTQTALETMADAVDARIDGVYGHSLRVAALAVSMAERLGLAPDEVDLVRQAARVHDIGKMEVADSILLKRGPLQAEERAILEQHIDHAMRILSRFPEYERCRSLVRSYHERPDGRGYPERCRGLHIPLGAAIIGVAESFDAMTLDRPYRDAMHPSRACAELSAGAGTVWNEAVVQALLDDLRLRGVLPHPPQGSTSVVLPC